MDIRGGQGIKLSRELNLIVESENPVIEELLV